MQTSTSRSHLDFDEMIGSTNADAKITDMSASYRPGGGFCRVHCGAGIQIF
jgi:hypothetical protein